MPRVSNTHFRLRCAWPLAVLVLCVVAAGGCGDDEPAAGTGTPAALAGTQWVLDLESLGVSGAGAVSSFIAFERERVSGSDGCNRFSGSYELDGSALTFGALAGTQMACAGPADAVARKVNAALPRVRRVERDGQTLRMQDDDARPLLTYLASAAGVEGSWSATSVLYDDAIRGIVTGAQPTAHFSDDGGITGFTGCNSLSGSYTLDDEKLAIDPLATTKKACPSQEASEQEAGYLAALQSAVRIDQVADGLTLLNAKGQMAVVFERVRG